MFFPCAEANVSVLDDKQQFLGTVGNVFKCPLVSVKRDRFHFVSFSVFLFFFFFLVKEKQHKNEDKRKLMDPNSVLKYSICPKWNKNYLESRKAEQTDRISWKCLYPVVT